MSLVPASLGELPADLKGGIVAIGNFDGVHRGHLALLEKAIGDGKAAKRPAVVLTFEPHPRTFFRPEAPVFRLTPLPTKAEILAAVGIDGLVVLPFDKALSSLSADDFIGKILVGELGLAGAVVGHDFHFGKGRAGTPDLLRRAGAAAGFAVSVVSPVKDDHGAPVSSSVIREALESGDARGANDLLGHRWFVTGEVIGGNRRGRELGFPTANIRLAADCRLRHGIYAVTFTRADGSVFGGVANYGRRPMFDNGAPLLEVYVFDFSGDLYGETVAVTVLDWVRGEERFPNVEGLIVAMNHDSEQAREVAAATGTGTAIDEALATARRVV